MRGSLFMCVAIALALLFTAALGFTIVDHKASDSGTENDGLPGDITPAPALVTMQTSDLVMITNNSGSRSKIDFSVYRPEIPDEGWYMIGDVAEASFSAHTRQATLVRTSDPYALAPPEDWTMIYADYQSGAMLDMSLWIPVPPEGYVALGCVAVRGYDKPAIPAFRCVNESYCTKGKPGSKIWDDTWSGATWDGSAWSVIPSGSSGLDASTFWAGSSHSKPADRVYCLDKTYLGV